MDNYCDESSVEIIKAFQENITCQTLTQPQRQNFYLILYNLLNKSSKKISTDFPSDYMYSLISGMDSESDPRNLLFLFSFLPKAFTEIPLKHLTEEAFAVLECYFPVDFTPVAEKGNISREDLAQGLEACLVANPAFAEYCIPVICDKMESSLKVAQMDSLRLIISGSRSWNIEHVNPFIKRLWYSIKDVLIPGNDQEVALLAGEALTSLLGAFSTAALSDGSTESLKFLLESIISTTHGYLSNPSLSLFFPTLRLLHNVIAVSSTTAIFILPKILPQLLALLEINSDQTDVILKALSPILVSSVKFECWESDTCQEHLYKLLPIILKNIEDDKCRGSAFACLTAILNKIPNDRRLSLYAAIPTIICSESFHSCREEFSKFIRKLSEEYTLEVENNLICTFKISDEFNANKVKNYLEVLTWAIDYPLLTEAGGKVLLSHIIMKELASWRSDVIFVLREYVNKTDVNVLRSLSSVCGFPEKLLCFYFEHIAKEDEIESVADIVMKIVQTLDIGEQRAIFKSGLELFNKSISTNDSSCNQMVLLEGLACGLRKEVEIENFLELSTNLIEYSITARSNVAQESAARLLAVFINKLTNESELDKILELAKSKMETNLNRSSVRLSAWITKSLILRGYYPACDDWLVELFNLVPNSVYGMDAADCVCLLLKECPYLSEANHCSIGLLYKQRIFQKINLLISQDGTPKKSSSLAVAHMLKYSPTILVLGVINELTGMMVHCLESDDSSIALAILETLSSLLEAGVDVLGTLAETFIPRFILLAQTSSYMDVRKEALNCIYLYGKYDSMDMLPYKNKVLAGLQKCLDDKKRLVRQSAVKARTRWFLI
ncbi:MMS19 nucleotide excision repair protein homolog isoform X2 [Halyomorpha halys]